MKYYMIFLREDGEEVPCELQSANHILDQIGDPLSPAQLADLVQYCVVPIPAGHEPVRVEATTE